MDDYPALHELWRAGGLDEPEDPFDFGLACTLDGIGALVRDAGRGDRDTAQGGDRTAGHGAGAGRVMRSVTRFRPRAARRCSVCGTPLDVAARGRPRDYCSRACQQRAYRRRRPTGLTRTG